MFRSLSLKYDLGKSCCEKREILFLARKLILINFSAVFLGLSLHAILSNHLELEFSAITRSGTTYWVSFSRFRINCNCLCPVSTTIQGTKVQRMVTQQRLIGNQAESIRPRNLELHGVRDCRAGIFSLVCSDSQS